MPQFHDKTYNWNTNLKIWEILCTPLGIMMFELIVKVVVSILAIPVVILVLLAIVFVLSMFARLFEKTIEDSDFGAITRSVGKTWIGALPAGSVLARKGREQPDFQADGTKTELNSDHKALLLALGSRWGHVDEMILECFAAEVLEDGPEITSRAAYSDARENDLQRLQKFTRISHVCVEQHEETDALTLEVHLLHKWDPEHSRLLILSDRLEKLDYGLTVEM